MGRCTCEVWFWTPSSLVTITLTQPISTSICFWCNPLPIPQQTSYLHLPHSRRANFTMSSILLLSLCIAVGQKLASERRIGSLSCAATKVPQCLRPLPNFFLALHSLSPPHHTLMEWANLRGQFQPNCGLPRDAKSGKLY